MSCDLLIIGAGAKAAAVAAKVHAINTLGLGSIALTIVEGTEPAASWSGLNGMTSGDEPLAVPPIKDVGFPWSSAEVFGDAGLEIDRGLLAFSWQNYLIGKGTYARWVNAGSPSIRHRDYGAYLAWVLSQATEGITMVRGHAERLTVDADRDCWVADVVTLSGEERHEGRALMLTGPGVHRHLPHDPDAAPRMFHCDSQRSELARIPHDRPSEIAVVGGGESALSCVAFLRGLRPDARLTVYTPTLPMSRGESFLENRVYANPDSVGWDQLDVAMRRAFIKHTDRGVFDPASLAAIAFDDRYRFVTGRVLHVGAQDGGRRVSVEYDTPDGPTSASYDYVVNCTGFDPMEQLRGLLAPAAKARVEQQAGRLWDTAPESEIAIGRALELVGVQPRLHVPSMGGLSQGPGFANLGSLGLLANRILQPLLVGDEAAVGETASS